MVREDGELIRLAVVTGTHGLRGEIKVHLLLPDAPALLGARTVYLGGDGDWTAYRPVGARMHKGQVLLRLEGMDRIESVQPLLGSQLAVRRDQLEPLPEDEIYWVDLRGMSVVDRQRGELGTLKDLFTTAAHDIYVVEGPFDEILIPVVKEFILEIDRENRRILVDLPRGLVRENDEV